MPLAVNKLSVAFLQPENRFLTLEKSHIRLMRIAYLSTMKSYYGGEVCLTGLAAGMRDKGHDVLGIVRRDSALAVQLPKVGVATAPLAPVDWYEPRSMWHLKRLLHRHQVDILHTHVPRDYYIAAVATWGTQIRNVGTRHLLKPISHPFLKRPFLKGFDGLIAVSDAVRQQVLAAGLLPQARVHTIYNGIESPGTLCPGLGLRQQAHVGPEDLVVGFVGRLCPDKGLETLFRAWARLRPTTPQAKLFILGSDSGTDGYGLFLRNLAQQLDIAHSVVFFDYVAQANQAPAEFDLQVVCSRAEPFGLVTLEAMSHGCPVIATDSGGSPEILQNGQGGILVPVDDIETLAGQMKRLLSDPNLRRTMGRQGAQRLNRYFTMDRMLEQTETLYMEVLGRCLQAEARATA